MKTLLEPIKELECVQRAEEILQKRGTSALISGCVDSQKWNMAFGLSKDFKNRVIVTYSDARIKEIYEDCRIYDKNVCVYPAKDVVFYQADIHSNQLTKDRLRCIRRLLQGTDSTIITTFSGLMNVGADLNLLKASLLRLKVGALVDEEAVKRRLTAMGYERTYQVETCGQFSVRGGIIDIFDLTEENPVRVELWGDEIDSIRIFDANTQRSLEKLETVTIYPATELPIPEGILRDGLDKITEDAKKLSKAFRDKNDPESAHRLEIKLKEITEEITEFPWSFNADSYVKYFLRDLVSLADCVEDALFIIDEPARVSEHADMVELEFKDSMKNRLEKGYIVPGQANVLFGKDMVLSKMKKSNMLLLTTMETKVTLLKPDLRAMVYAHSIPSYNNDFSQLLKDLNNYRKRGYKVLILSGSKTRAERLSKDIQENDVLAFYSDNRERILQNGEIETMHGYVVRGFEYPELKFAVISEGDIFGKENFKKRVKKYTGKTIKDFNDLHVGDYVVHESHGVGVYKGIEKIEVEKVAKDYMKIEYAEGGVLYVLATALDAIMKYASADFGKPKLNKLGGKEWEKTTGKVRSAVDEVATELVNLYAARSRKPGHAYQSDTVWQQEFEELFPYEETKDQLDAIEATKQDMESTKIMDRLICGDVGFGKTEIAIRAAFKAVQEGKQVAFLVPTTILAQQHYNTFLQRMKDFPIRVDLLSRFVTKSRQDKTISDVKKGLVDIVIGTHRILSKDMNFKDLGLLIIDEEQRFGVSQKEKIKQLKEDVDVLTLTATPIPRTLHMSLVGIRDMSLLEEAPNDRMPIQTYVMEYDDEMVREAINRELSRNGQVYYVYNRVNNIADIAANVQKLVPDANVAFAHGQMKETELERIMYEFVKGEIDVLVSTTIVETGIDIPNVNTMIIHNSDQMGLSQLYQLRGRVGRSNRTAYAYLMYKRDKILTEVAEKRLQTIRDFTDLGSGYRIATRDLEIRGAGNILGMSQHGHMAAVGYELYCKLLNQAVMRQKGEETTEDFSTLVDLDVDAFIPPEYIMNEVLKLDTYKKIASLESDDECEDMRVELKDRFGNLPDSAENLLKITSMRIRAHKLFISEIRGINGEITFKFLPSAEVRTENIDVLLKKYPRRLSLSAKGVPTFTYSYEETGEVTSDERLLLESTDRVLNDMWELLAKNN